jgi:hypothetical protein
LEVEKINEIKALGNREKTQRGYVDRKLYYDVKLYYRGKSFKLKELVDTGSDSTVASDRILRGKQGTKETIRQFDGRE